ncbi:MAG: hypothetical protein L0228_12825 [Planctomycetes bacterium]|nr:hypothetical protein [Planctomycetota bacterium]
MYRFPQSIVLLLSTIALTAPNAQAAAPFVPGTGEFLRDCCDDFENPNWSYRYNHPKSSHEQDDRQRSPGGRSNNNLWHEGGKRGTPDLVKRVDTPLGGIPGSTGALMFATRNSGIPGRVANSQQQDDLLMLFDRRLGRSIPIAWQPSCTARVYLPPFEEWENRTGPQFGMRCDCTGRNPDGSVEAYWPGMFLLFQSETSRNVETDSAKISVRGDRLGHDIRKIDIAEPGWWTLGLSFTSDGQVHYYASEGIDDLTSDDYVMSSFPYSMRCMTFNNFFFNVANWENGRSWSTKWVIDDPKIFVQPPPGQTAANLYRIKKKPQTAKKPQTMRNRTTRQQSPNQRSAANSRANASR